MGDGLRGSRFRVNPLGTGSGPSTVSSEARYRKCATLTPDCHSVPRLPPPRL